ncbi:MAG: uroporphyrinogen-III synthase [Oceanicaulis sp.]
MKPVLVTRAEPGATRSVKALEGLGYRALNAATATVAFDLPAPDLSNAAALAFTSPNGAAAAGFHNVSRDLPVYAVGDATAEAARDAGFDTVKSAAGDGAALARLILADAPKGRVMHLSGTRQGFDLVAALTEGGVTAERHAVYRTVPAPPYGPELVSVLPGAVALIHSPAGAERFLARLDAEGIAANALSYAAISRAAAAPAVRAGARGVAIAAEPNEAALFSALGIVFRRSA